MKFNSAAWKRTICAVLVLLAVLAPASSFSGEDSLFIPAAAADSYTYTYYPRYTGSSGSIVTALKAIGVDSSYSNRKTIAAMNNILNYSGTASQNTQMLQLLKQGKLIRSKTAVSTPSNGSGQYYPRYTGSSGSIVTGLNAIKVDSSFANRKLIAASNGISNYSGTAAQNIQMLNLLKQGKLKKAGSTGGKNGGSTTSNRTGGGTVFSQSGGNVEVSNRALPNKPYYTSRVNYRGQDAYNIVIDQFRVTSNPRYKRTSNATWCNIFAWDVMSAMGATLPHWVREKGVPSDNNRTSGAWEMNANATYNWLKSYGSRYGWSKVSAYDAQQRANKGYPTVAVWKNGSGSGHIAVIRPESGSYTYSAAKGPVIAQAGGSNYNYTNVIIGFGSSRMGSVVYWTAK